MTYYTKEHNLLREKEQISDLNMKCKNPKCKQYSCEYTYSAFEGPIKMRENPPVLYIQIIIIKMWGIEN